MIKLLRKPIFWIFLLSLFVRTYKLDQLPLGFHVDEVKVAWNAVSIANTAKDDQGNFLPLYYNTFGDWRPALIFYLTIPSIVLFGENIFAVRFTSAFAGALTVAALYFFAKKLSDKKTALISALVLSLNPWHISTSRSTNEIIISSLFVILSLYFFSSIITDGPSKKTSPNSLFVLGRNKFDRQYIYFSISTLLAILSYHSPRITLPVGMLVILIYKNISVLKDLIFHPFKYYPKIKLGLSLVAIVGLISILFVILGPGKERFSQVSIFKNEDINYEVDRVQDETSKLSKVAIIFNNKALIYIRNIVYEYGKYFSTDFLIGQFAKPYRYLTPGHGLISFYELFLFLVGIFYIVRKNIRQGYLYILLLSISPIAAIFTIEDSPNLNRSLMMSIFIAIIVGHGLIYFQDKLSYFKNKFLKYLPLLFLVLSFVNFSYLYQNFSGLKKPYIKNLVIDSPSYRNEGAVELVKQIEQMSIENKSNTIYVTNFPDNVYPWYAFFNNVNPHIFNRASYQQSSNQRVFSNIVFTDDRCPSDKIENYKINDIVIDSGYCDVDAKINDGLPASITRLITRDDETNAFYILIKT